MSNNFHVWYYIKDFAIFNTKQNISLPSELVHYIYSYIITYELKKKINYEYIYYCLHKQLTYNKRLRGEHRNAKIYPYNEQGYRNNEELLATSNMKNFIYNCWKFPHIGDELTFHTKNLPYSSIITIETLYWIVDKLVKFKQYRSIKCTHNGRYYSHSYENHKVKKTGDNIDFLLIKLYSGEESDY